MNINVIEKINFSTFLNGIEVIQTLAFQIIQGVVFDDLKNVIGPTGGLMIRGSRWKGERPGHSGLTRQTSVMLRAMRLSMPIT